MLLNCLDTDPQRFRTLSTLVIVRFSLSPPLQVGPLSDELRSAAQQHTIALFSFWDLVDAFQTHASSFSVSKPTEHDLCMICYTSGTTGVPKGALLTHGNMVAVTTAVVEYIQTIGGLENTDAHVSYLPMAHVFEHFVQCGVTFFGARIGFYQVAPRESIHSRATRRNSSTT